MNLPDKVKAKLKELPDQPGVYMMRDRRGKIIYVGKAISLRKRVQSYFRQGTLKSADVKLRGLIRSIGSFDFVALRSDAEATLTESRLIKDYRPRYNVLLKDDKRFLLLKVNKNDPMPRFDSCRIKKEDGATYFGPYTSSASARVTLDFIDRRFGLRRCFPKEPGATDYKHCLNDIIRYCSAPCVEKVTREQYAERVGEACAFLNGERPVYFKELREAMKEASEAMHFESAAAIRDTLFSLQRIVKQRARVQKTKAMLAEDAQAGLRELKQALNLNEVPEVIETFDISNISGTYAVGSMVCSVHGIPRPARYRQFRIKSIIGSDDPGMMAEVIARCYGRRQRESKPMPNLILVDGGITQVRAARAELKHLGLEHIPVAGLAKRFEEIVRDEEGVDRALRLPRESNGLKVLQNIRDEAHRFALTYHRKLRAKRIRESILDDIPGIGGKRKKQLLQHFGSVSRLRKASAAEISEVPGFGSEMSRLIHASFSGQQQEDMPDKPAIKETN